MSYYGIWIAVHVNLFHCVIVINLFFFVLLGFQVSEKEWPATGMCVLIHELKNSLMTLLILFCVPSVTTPPSLVFRLPSWSIEGGSGNETATPPRCSDMGVTFVFHLGMYFGSKMFMAISSTPPLSDFSSHKGSWSLETHRWPHAHQRGATDQWPGSCPPGSKVLLPVHAAGGGGEVVRPPLRPSDIKVRTKLCLILHPTFRPLCFYLLPFISSSPSLFLLPFLLPSFPSSLPSSSPLPPSLTSFPLPQAGCGGYACLASWCGHHGSEQRSLESGGRVYPRQDTLGEHHYMLK